MKEPAKTARAPEEREKEKREKGRKRRGKREEGRGKIGEGVNFELRETLGIYLVLVKQKENRLFVLLGYRLGKNYSQFLVQLLHKP